MTDDPFNLPETAAERLAREILDPPAERLRRDYEASSAARLALEYANPPTQLAEREMALALRSEFTGATAEAAKLLADHNPVAIDPSVLAAMGQIKPIRIDPGLVKAMAEFKPMAIDPELLERINGAVAIKFDPRIAAALGSIKPIEIDPGLGGAIAEAQKALAGFGEPYGGIAEAVRAIEDQQRSFAASLIATLGSTIGDATRVNQWALALGRIAVPDIASVFAGAPNVAAQVEQMHAAVHANLTGIVGRNQAEMSAMLGLGHKFGAVLETTSFKMSAFAGITDVGGVRTSAWDEAYQSLFGAWRTRPDLPNSYWRDPRARRRMYDAAEVDPGLAGAGLGIAVEVMVESGLAPGVRSEANAVAVIKLGEMSMTIRSRGTRNDAFALLGRFEEELRAYITRKLSGRFGPDWFKVRIDGNTAGAAKRTRVQALQRGEIGLPLINYTDIGDLSNILRADKNWKEVFEEVFINSSSLDHDMQKLIAARRPTVHTRPMDAVRLVEMVCVIDRLSKQMADDGAWKLIAESDE
jgi:hypothetical protein